MKNIMFLALLLVVSSVNTALAVAPEITPVPEPGTFVLLGLGAVGLVVYKKFKK